MRVLLYDNTDRLTIFWAAGRYLSKWDAVISASSWKDALEQLWELDKPVMELQFWGHGAEGFPLIDGFPLSTELQKELAEACDFQPESVVWWRACDVFSGERGQRFAVSFCQIAGCSHVGHTRVISWPWPIFHSGGHGIRPGATPHWDVTEGEEDNDGSGPSKPNTCLVTRMKVPESWWTT
jgi:hypothetical protein